MTQHTASSDGKQRFTKDTGTDTAIRPAKVIELTPVSANGARSRRRTLSTEHGWDHRLSYHLSRACLTKRRPALRLRVVGPGSPHWDNPSNDPGERCHNSAGCEHIYAKPKAGEDRPKGNSGRKIDGGGAEDGYKNRHKNGYNERGNEPVS